MRSQLLLHAERCLFCSLHRLTVMKCVFAFASGVVSTVGFPCELHKSLSVPVSRFFPSLSRLIDAGVVSISWLCTLCGAPVRVSRSPSPASIRRLSVPVQQSEAEIKSCVRVLEGDKQKGCEHARTWKYAEPQCARPGASPSVKARPRELS